MIDRSGRERIVGRIADSTNSDETARTIWSFLTCEFDCTRMEARQFMQNMVAERKTREAITEGVITRDCDDHYPPASTIRRHTGHE